MNYTPHPKLMIDQISHKENICDNLSPETQDKKGHRKQVFKKIKKKISQQVQVWNIKYSQWDSSNQNISLHRKQRMAESLQIILRSSVQQDAWVLEISHLFIEIKPRIEAVHELICNQLKKKFFDFRYFQAFYSVLWQNICEKLWDQFYSSNFILTTLVKSGSNNELSQFIVEQIVIVQKNHSQEPIFSDDQEDEYSNKKNEKKIYELGKNIHIKNYEYNNYHLVQLLDEKYVNKFAERFNQLPEKWRERLKFNFKKVFE